MPVKKVTFPSVPNGARNLESEVLKHVARLHYADQLIEKVDEIPITMVPDGEDACEVARKRAGIRQRILAMLGYRVEKLGDEEKTLPLSEFVKKAYERKQEDLELPVITFLPDVCNKCADHRIFVTDACQNCTAQPCAKVCPKGAISHPNGRAFIDDSKCIRCGKCTTVCPFKAIVAKDAPCKAACPVGAITDKDGVKSFDFEKCLNCAACGRACPFGAIMPRSQLIDILKLLHPLPGTEKTPVVAMVAPAVVGHFGNAVPLPEVMEACRKLGFTEAIEVARGADTTSINECHEFFERMEEYEEAKAKGEVGKPGQKLPFMATSCCPAWVRCAHNYCSEIEQAVSDTKPPAHYTADIAKVEVPGCKTVFVGPCNAKLGEAIWDPNLDFAMTFHEFAGLIHALEVEIDTDEAKAKFDDKVSSQGRGFPVIAGVTASVLSFAKDEDVARFPPKPIVIDGLTPFSVKALKGFAKKAPAGNLIEVMCCPGGCIYGPGTAVPAVAASQAQGRVALVVKKSASHADAHPVKMPPCIIYRGKEIIDQTKK